VHFGAFYRRRVLRLLPVIVVFVCAHAVFARASHIPFGLERSSVQAVLLYYTNWRSALGLPLAEGFGHLWSLAIEEQFYLVWPFVMTLIGLRAHRRTALVVLVGLIAAVAIRRYVLWHQGGLHGFVVLRLYNGTDTRADALLVGALVAHLWVRGRVPRRYDLLRDRITAVARRRDGAEPHG
jgi:peptidoglycan/LPS O-acetylase OafA/YrhL